MARPKSNLRQFLEALNRNELVELASRAGVSLSQRRNIAPILADLLRNKSKVQDAVPEFLSNLSRDELKHMCEYFELDPSGRAKEPIVARILESLDLATASSGSSDVQEQSAGRPQIFVVHGHDIAMRQVVVHFLAKIGINAIVLADQPNTGKTIIEKLETHINPDRCQHAIVLLSPDDVGHKAGHASEQKDRPRQNVIFEFGMVVGRLGRRNVMVLHRGNVEIPTDIDGVVYIRYEHDNPGALVGLARELRSMGYNIDGNALL